MACFLSLFVAANVLAQQHVCEGTLDGTMCWKDYNGPAEGGYMPDIDQNQPFSFSMSYSLDFDEDDTPPTPETQSGWTSFTIAPYSPVIGYGWDNITGIDDRNRGTVSNLSRDFHFSSQDRTFMVDLPNGSYLVSVVMGDLTNAHDNMTITAEGTYIGSFNTAVNGFGSVPFTVTVSDGQLNILFHDAGGADPNWVVNGIRIIAHDHEYSAPVAEANSLWWLDKRYQLGIFVDPYNGLGYIGGDINGNGFSDRSDLVQDLAIKMNTNAGVPGTRVEDERNGINDFLRDYGLDDQLGQHTKYYSDFPDPLQFFEFIEEEVYRCQDVKLDLSIWHVTDCQPFGIGYQCEWQRIGCHTVTVAGVDSTLLQLAISDPYFDAAEAGLAPGVIRPGPHGYPHDPDVHNNEMFASHDIYTVSFPGNVPRGIALQGYPLNCSGFACPSDLPDFGCGFHMPVTTNSSLPTVGNATVIAAAVVVSPLVCGDSIIGEPGEECDDGNTNSGDGCSSTCKIEFCGDGIVNNQPNEECDDGNNISEDGCSAICRYEFCGDLIVQRGLGETCDPTGGQLPPNGNPCNLDCTYCGDGNTDTHEQCDDGNPNNNDFCRNDCILPTCGDGIISTGETCDPPWAPGPEPQANICRETCTYCGDGISNNGEQCDDGNGINNDGCKNDCTIGITCSFLPGGTTLIRGGTLSFWVTVTNNDDVTQDFKFATNVKLPSGNMYPTPPTYLIGPADVSLNAGDSKSKQLHYGIPLGAQYGTYTYYGYIGKPGIGLYGSCQFNFTVVQ
jgi:cysteine-rich repeat protein